MLVALAMLNCVELSEGQEGHKAIRVCSLIYCVVFVGQFLLQLAGVLDLRQMLKATHAAIIVSAAALCFSGVSAWIRRLRRSDRTAGGNYSLLLGIGAITDLLLHYFAETSVGMLFTLGAILCYSMLEGIRMLIRYTEQKNELEEMHTQLTLSRTTTMMSQIRSHFVFNILNAISGMCKYDPEKADDTVVRFARYLRNNIDIMEDDKNIPFAADLRQLEDYVMLEQVRFGDKLEFYTDVETDQFMIPPLILQPVVENAIKHGISKKQSDGTIILRTRDAGENIVITVEDDGVGFDTQELSKEKSVGLKNIRFRLHHLVNGTLDIASEEGKGTITLTAGDLEKTISVTIEKPRTVVSIDSSHWAHEAVDYCNGKNILDGMHVEGFSWDNNITRAQFVLALYNVLGQPATTHVCDFTDVAPSDYYYKALCWGQELGIAGGMGDGTFGVNGTLTREQAVTMLGRVVELAEDGKVSDGSGLKKGKTEVAAFTDDAKIGSWAKNYVAYFVSHGVVNGMTDGSFAPAANMTREQAMKVAVEALDK